jgi:hypothetical protein
VDLHPGRHEAGAVTFELAQSAQIGDVGDTEAGQGLAAGVVELRQLAGAVEAPGRDAGVLGDVTEVPGPRQLSAARDGDRRH